MARNRDLNRASSPPRPRAGAVAPHLACRGADAAAGNDAHPRLGAAAGAVGVPAGAHVRLATAGGGINAAQPHLSRPPAAQTPTGTFRPPAALQQRLPVLGAAVRWPTRFLMDNQFNFSKLTLAFL